METKRTYYETLGLKEGCSIEEIRASFVTLSKKYHPDKDSKDPGLHAKFVDINEAYSVLSKPLLRRSYDFDLRTARTIEAQKKYYNSTAGSDERYPPNFVWRDETIWPMRDKGSDKSQNDKAYYGIKGVSRKPNSWIALGAFGIMAVGMIFHYVTFKHSRTFTISQLNKKDSVLSEQLERARKLAEANGNEVQFQIFLQKMESKKHGDE